MTPRALASRSPAGGAAFTEEAMALDRRAVEEGQEPMTDHRIVSREGWLAARRAVLVQEKEFTRARDALSRQRRELPWEKVSEAYAFEGARGRETLADLFERR